MCADLEQGRNPGEFRAGLRNVPSWLLDREHGAGITHNGNGSGLLDMLQNFRSRSGFYGPEMRFVRVDSVDAHGGLRVAHDLHVGGTIGALIDSAALADLTFKFSVTKYFTDYFGFHIPSLRGRRARRLVIYTCCMEAV